MPWQRLVADVGGELDDDGNPAYRDVIVVVPRQSGKALSISTPMLTTSGWKTMSDLVVGDEVLAADGSPTRVTYTSEVFLGHRCYEVEFTDGAVITADAEHLWWVFDLFGHDPAEWAKRTPGKRNYRKGAWKMMTTAQLADTRWGQRRASNERMEYRYRVRCDAVAELPVAELPIDPYVLGYWLGDGNSASPTLTVGGQDLAHVRGELDRAAYRIVSERQDPRTGVWRVRFNSADRSCSAGGCTRRSMARGLCASHYDAQRRSGGFTADAVGGDGVTQRLRRLGVLGDKHIPEVYLTASAEQRRALLAGLLDSDGTIGGTAKTPRVEFSVTSKRLAHDFLRLARSLGIRTNLIVGEAKLQGRLIGARYRVAWTPAWNPFRLPRKAEKWLAPVSHRHELMSIVGIREVPSVPTRCIQVEHPSHVYLAGELLTPTHNTTLVLAWELQRAIHWAREGPQKIVYSAQTGLDGRQKLVDDQYPILEPRKKVLGIQRCLRSIGSESVKFRNGSQIVVLASTEQSGHGKTVHFAVKDELFADVDNHRDQALVPAMNTVASAQVLATSTMGTDASVALNAAVARGRDAAGRGLRTGTAYFEWSASEDADPDDEAVWWSCMPALGHTIGLPAVRHARATLELAEFRRAYLNIMDGRRAEPVIPADKWRACARPTASIPSPRTWSLDVTPDRSTGCIAVAGRDGQRSYVEVVEHRPGTAWMPGRAAELVARHGGQLVMDAAGPASSLLAALAEVGMEPRLMSTREAVQACGGFYDAVIQGTLSHIDQAPLNAAVDGADRRQLTDAWLWSRRSSSVDICPLVAVTQAHWGSGQPDELAPITEANTGIY